MFMSNGLLSVSDIFINKLFRIPDYQRGYAWGENQLRDFWEDVVNLSVDKYHYTGLLTLEETSFDSNNLDIWLVDSNYRVFNVIDGQQRLTSILILIFEILKLISKTEENINKMPGEIYINYDSLKSIEEKYIRQSRPPERLITSYIFGYETENASFDFLKHGIFDQPNSRSLHDSYYSKNLMFAKRFFKENLDILHSIEGIEGIESLFQKITTRLIFNVQYISEIFDVHVAFETMNNRGKSLSNLELLKNRLIYLSTLFKGSLDKNDEKSLRNNINETWGEIYYHLGRNPSKLLVDDELLRSHWSVYFGKKGYAYKEYLLSLFSPYSLTTDYKHAYLNDHIINKQASNNKIDPQTITIYLNNLKSYAEAWYLTFFPNDSTELSKEEKIWITRLNHINHFTVRSITASVIQLRHTTTSDQRIQFFTELERTSFLFYKVATFNVNYKESEFITKAKAYREGDTSIEEFAQYFIDIEKNLKYSILHYFYRDVIAPNFEKGKGFYGWSSLYYFLYEYENSLSKHYNISRLQSELFSTQDNDGITIEHIFPQAPSNEYWNNYYGQFDDKEKQDLAGSLGNLVLLSHSINASLQNDDFPNKKNPSNKRRGYSNGSHSEIVVSQNENWTAKDIFERGIHLLEFMEERWRIEIPYDIKVELLSINFILESNDNDR